MPAPHLRSYVKEGYPMDSNFSLQMRITHAQNLPSAEALADLAAVALNEVLAADPQLRVTAVLQAAAIALDDRADSIALPERFAYLRRR